MFFFFFLILLILFITRHLHQIVSLLYELKLKLVYKSFRNNNIRYYKKRCILHVASQMQNDLWQISCFVKIKIFDIHKREIIFIIFLTMTLHWMNYVDYSSGKAKIFQKHIFLNNLSDNHRTCSILCTCTYRNRSFILYIFVNPSFSWIK